VSCVVPPSLNLFLTDGGEERGEKGVLDGEGGEEELFFSLGGKSVRQEKRQSVYRMKREEGTPSTTPYFSSLPFRWGKEVLGDPKAARHKEESTISSSGGGREGKNADYTQKRSIL